MQQHLFFYRLAGTAFWRNIPASAVQERDRSVLKIRHHIRGIFTLRYFSFMSGEEIGEACGLRGSAVVMRLVRIRKKLKKALEHDGIYI